MSGTSQPWRARVRGPQLLDGHPVVTGETARESWAYSWTLARLGEESVWPGEYNDVAADMLAERGEVDERGEPLSEEGHESWILRPKPCSAWGGVRCPEPVTLVRMDGVFGNP